MTTDADPVAALIEAFLEAAPPGAQIQRTALGLELRTADEIALTWPGAKDKDGKPCVYFIDRAALREAAQRLLETPIPLDWKCP